MCIKVVIINVDDRLGAVAGFPSRSKPIERSAQATVKLEVARVSQASAPGTGFATGAGSTIGGEGGGSGGAVAARTASFSRFSRSLRPPLALRRPAVSACGSCRVHQASIGIALKRMKPPVTLLQWQWNQMAQFKASRHVSSTPQSETAPPLPKPSRRLLL